MIRINTVGLKTMSKTGVIVELLVTGVTTVACGVLVMFGSLYGRVFLLEGYGYAMEMLPLVTILAITAFWWAPYLYGSLLIVLLVVRIRYPGCRWITWSALCIASLAAAIVVFGMARPVVTTMFSMGESPPGSNQPNKSE